MPKSGPIAFFSGRTIFEANDVPPEKLNEKGTLQGKSLSFVLFVSWPFQLLAVAISEHFNPLFAWKAQNLRNNHYFSYSQEPCLLVKKYFLYYEKQPNCQKPQPTQPIYNSWSNYYTKFGFSLSIEESCRIMLNLFWLALLGVLKETVRYQVEATLNQLSGLLYKTLDTNKDTIETMDPNRKQNSPGSYTDPQKLEVVNSCVISETYNMTQMRTRCHSWR